MPSKKDLKREVGKLWLDVRTLSDQIRDVQDELRDAQDESAAFEANAEGWRIEFENAVAESEAKDKELADLRRQLSKAREAFEVLKAALFPPIPGLAFGPNVLHGWRAGIAPYTINNEIFVGPGGLAMERRTPQAPIPTPSDGEESTEIPSEGDSTREEISDAPDEVSKLTEEHRDWEWERGQLRYRFRDGSWWCNAISNYSDPQIPNPEVGWIELQQHPPLPISFDSFVRVKT